MAIKGYHNKGDRLVVNVFNKTAYDGLLCKSQCWSKENEKKNSKFKEKIKRSRENQSLGIKII